MNNEWLDLAYINFDKVILHGRICTGVDAEGCNLERLVEQELTEEQKQLVYDLNFKHQCEMNAVLRGFVNV